MRDTFEQVIASGNFNLAELLRTIDTYHIEGKLTDTDRVELYAAARAAANPQYNYATEIEAIWVEFRRLQGLIEELQKAIDSGSGSGGTGGGDEPSDEWPPYVQPTGAHDAYQVGDKISFNGKHYICILNNCVWDPATYPAGWQEQA